MDGRGTSGRGQGWGISRRGVLGGAGALGALGLLGLTGCGAGSAPGGDKPSGAGAAPPQTIRFAWWQQDYKPFWDQIFPKFTEATNIKVELEFYMSGAAWAEKMTALFASDSQPDAAHSSSMTDTRYYDAGNILDLSPTVAREKLNIDKDYVLMGTERWCGKIYALPYFAEPFGIYYNKTLLKQLGQPDPWVSVKGDWTWDQMMNLAKLATQDTDRDGKVDQWGMYWPYNPPGYFGPWAWTFGANFIDWDNMKYQWSSAGSVQAVQKLQNAILRDHYFMHVDEWNAVRMAQGGVKEAFQGGKTLFWFRSVTDIPRNRLQIGSDFEWDVLPVPKADASHPGVGFQAGHPNWVAAKTKVKDAATRFVFWLSQDESQGHMADTKYLMPALKSMHPRFVKLNPGESPEHIQQFPDVFKKPYGWHFRHHATPDADALFLPIMNAILKGERPLVPGLQEMDTMMQQKLEVGPCSPYKGTKIPRPGSP
jgi:ABC-type glycerol-3-phosphate transport system substrate-binding protein